MASDLNKHLDRARRSLEKNKLREAVAEYQAVLEEAPANQEALQALADIYTRLNEPALAAQYYGAQFDRLIEAGDAAKASAIFTRFLRSFPQPPDRLMRYATLLQKQNRSSEAIEQFSRPRSSFCSSSAISMRWRVTRASRSSILKTSLGTLFSANWPSASKHADLAARSFLRAGQLAQAAGGLDQALEYFGRAHRLLPSDRTGALLFADAKLRKGDAEGAVALLEPLSPNEKDTAFLALFGEALLRTRRLDRAREIFEAYYKQKPENFSKLFELAAAYLGAGEDPKAASLLAQAKEWMYGARKEAELVPQIERLATTYPNSLALAEDGGPSLRGAESRSEIFRRPRPALRSLSDCPARAGRVRYTRPPGGYRSVRLPQSGANRATRGKGRSCFLAEYSLPRRKGRDRLESHRVRIFGRRVRCRRGCGAGVRGSARSTSS